MEQSYYRRYRTKEEWDRQARIFILFGFICGIGIGTAGWSFVWLLTRIIWG